MSQNKCFDLDHAPQTEMLPNPANLVVCAGQHFFNAQFQKHGCTVRTAVLRKATNVRPFFLKKMRSFNLLEGTWHLFLRIRDWQRSVPAKSKTNFGSITGRDDKLTQKRLAFATRRCPCCQAVRLASLKRRLTLTEPRCQPDPANSTPELFPRSRRADVLDLLKI
jgi:hypothetical protein